MKVHIKELRVELPNDPFGQAIMFVMALAVLAHAFF
jgi:hypothetical protein